MVTVPRETPSLPLMLRDDLAQYYGRKSLGKTFSAREQIVCQLSLSLLPFCEAESIFTASVLNSANDAKGEAEVRLLLGTRCLQLHALELHELWENTTDNSACSDDVGRGLRSWQGGTGIHNSSTARVLFSCSELTLTLYSSAVLFWP